MSRFVNPSRFVQQPQLNSNLGPLVAPTIPPDINVTNGIFSSNCDIYGTLTVNNLIVVNTMATQGTILGELNVDGFVNSRNSWKTSTKVVSQIAVVTSTISSGSIIDGYSLSVDDRILLVAQVPSSDNGIYVVPVTGSIIRTRDALDGYPAAGAGIYVTTGSSGINTLWFCSSGSSFGTSSVFNQFTGSSSVPGGINTSIQFNNSGFFGGSADLTFASNILTINGSIIATSSITSSSLTTGPLSATSGLFSGPLFATSGLFSGPLASSSFITGPMTATAISVGPVVAGAIISNSLFTGPITAGPILAIQASFTTLVSLNGSFTTLSSVYASFSNLNILNASFNSLNVGSAVVSGPLEGSQGLFSSSISATSASFTKLNVLGPLSATSAVIPILGSNSIISNSINVNGGISATSAVLGPSNISSITSGSISAINGSFNTFSANYYTINDLSVSTLTVTGPSILQGPVSASTITSIGSSLLLNVLGSGSGRLIINSNSQTGSGTNSSIMEIQAQTYTLSNGLPSFITSYIFSSVAQNLINSNSPTTIGTAANLYIAPGPLSGTNTRVNDSYSLWIAGNLRVDGSIIGVSTSGSTPPGGSNTQLQFNANGSFGGATALTWTSSTNTFSVGTSEIYFTTLSVGSGNAVAINSSGKLIDSVSYRRYKKDEVKVEECPGYDIYRVLELEPKFFTWKETEEEDLGLIVDDAIDKGLHEFIGPKNYKDRSLIASIIAVLKEHHRLLKEINL